MTPQPLELVLDWDGTVTEADTLHLALARFGDPEVYRRTEAALGRELTLHEVIGIEMRTIRVPLDEVVGYLLDVVRVRPGFAELVERRDPLLLSAGFRELIEPVLRREGVRARVAANTLRPSTDGWVAVFRDEASCAVCDEPCKRGATAGLAPFAYAGDGFSDRCVALAADVVFARDGLARYLDAEGVPYEPLTDFFALDRALDRIARDRDGEPVVPPTRSRGRKT